MEKIHNTYKVEYKETKSHDLGMLKQSSDRAINWVADHCQSLSNVEWVGVYIALLEELMELRSKN